ncbi:MAG TPA: hypothetical protein VN651_12930 [Gemmatimonadaceae bacterium]|nr:hypothetical protein [Gemmatimonadaceae bacterium]
MRTLPLAFIAPLLIAACTDSTEPSTTAFVGDTVVVVGNFRESGSASVSPLRAATDVGLLLTNESAQAETLISSARGACDGGIVARAWRNVNGRQILAWTSSAVPVIPCPGHALPIILAPHASVQLGQEIESSQLLGDSLPAGIYTFTVSADLASPSLPKEVATPPVAVSTHFIVPPGTVLDGRWAGGGDGIVLTISLHWTADSVTGTGTYQAFTPNTNHCGGATLRGSGTVSFRASRIADQVNGSMEFDNGWGPPYIAVLTGVGLLDGHFMSVDTGTCPMPLALQSP